MSGVDNEGYSPTLLSKLSRMIMIEITMKKDDGDKIKGKKYLVTPNIAFGLIDSGKAIKYSPRRKVMKPSPSKMYRVK